MSRMINSRTIAEVSITMDSGGTESFLAIGDYDFTREEAVELARELKLFIEHDIRNQVNKELREIWLPRDNRGRPFYVNGDKIIRPGQEAQESTLMDQAWPSKDWKKFGNGPYQILQLGPDVFIPPGCGGHPDYACTRKQLEQQLKEALELANAIERFLNL